MFCLAAIVTLSSCGGGPPPPSPSPAPPPPPPPPPVPGQASLVYLKSGDSRLFVQRATSSTSRDPEQALVIRGVAWEPTSPGDDPTSNSSVFQARYASAYQTDIPLMVAAGINVVRVYHDFGTDSNAIAVLDAFYRAGIWVIVEVGSPQAGVSGVLENIPPVVNAYSNHPALLMWAFGNEWDVAGFSSNSTSLALDAQRVNQAAQMIKALDTSHPVSTFIGDLHIDPSVTGTKYVHPLDQATAPWYSGTFTSDIVNSLATGIDAWATNLYRGLSFGDAFPQWRQITGGLGKPLLVGEFGIDRFDHRIMAENQSMQADGLSNLLDELYFDLSAERTNGTVIGGIVFEFSDEWWKNGQVSVQNPSNEQNGGQPDGYNDEEYFGLLNIQRSDTSYLGFQKVAQWYTQSGTAVKVQSAPQVSLSSASSAELQLDGRITYSRSGGSGGARGINVLVIDSNTGVRLVDSYHIDSWFRMGSNPVGRFDALQSYIRALPSGSIIAFVVADASGVNGDADSDALRTFMVNRGATQFGMLTSQNDRYALLLKIGGPIIAEQYVAFIDSNSTASIVATLTLNPDVNAFRRS
jgi:hypothetical protein